MLVGAGNRKNQEVADFEKIDPAGGGGKKDGQQRRPQFFTLQYFRLKGVFDQAFSCMALILSKAPSMACFSTRELVGLLKYPSKPQASSFSSSKEAI